MITLAQVKEFLQLDPDRTDQDSILTIILNSVKDRIELDLNIGLEVKERTIQWPGGRMQLPFGPVLSVEGDLVLDGDFIGSPAGECSYWRVINGVPTYSTSWATEDRNPSVTVTYTSGYSEIPATISAGILAWVDHVYRNRGTISEKAPDWIDEMLNKYNRNYVL